MNYASLTLCISACIIPAFTATPVEDGKCVKIYYTADDYYKFYCFRMIDNVLSIKTDKNDTIKFESTRNDQSCVKITGPNAMKPSETTCEDYSTEDCYKEGESLHFPNEESGNIPCKKSQRHDALLMQAKADKLVVIFDVISTKKSIIYVPYNRPERE
ncbi:unnamed protein product [Phyllotreta striolata]|uniref:Uncharacterized protein n=1 Tax=Phyllotreta striolata TaxID=444603 RepID=A0A9N9XQY3_PHYSR|nr:unnamed protein product [Phyllotreta striolata]